MSAYAIDTDTRSKRSGNARNFLEIDALLDDEERLLRGTVRRFGRGQHHPESHRMVRGRHVPKEMAKECGDLGHLGTHLEGYGCADMSARSCGLACTEPKAGDSTAPTRSISSFWARRSPASRPSADHRD